MIKLAQETINLFVNWTEFADQSDIFQDCS